MGYSIESAFDADGHNYCCREIYQLKKENLPVVVTGIALEIDLECQDPAEIN